MTEALPVRKRRWPAWLIFFGALAAAGGGFGIWLDRAAERRWERMVRRVAELKAEAEGRDGIRPVFGEPIEGDAWPDYEKVMEFLYRYYLAKGLDLRTEDLITDPDLAGVEVQVAVKKYLDRATRCRQVRMPEDARRGLRTKCLTAVAEAITQEVLRLDREGRSGDVVRRLLIWCQSSRDFAHDSNAEIEGQAFRFYRDALEGLKVAVLDPALSRPDLGEAERRLEVLDRNFPDRRAVLMNDLALRGERLSRWELYSGEGPVDRWELRSWRHVWNARIGVTDAFARLERWAARNVEAEGRSWDEARAERRAIDAEIFGARNPLLFAYKDSAGSNAALARHVRALLRLVRMAAHFRSTGEFLNLDDPFGEKLLHSDGETVKVWSVGNDGNDEDGEGDDLVIKVRRP